MAIQMDTDKSDLKDRPSMWGVLIEILFLRNLETWDLAILRQVVETKAGQNPVLIQEFSSQEPQRNPKIYFDKYKNDPSIEPITRKK